LVLKLWLNTRVWTEHHSTCRLKSIKHQRWLRFHGTSIAVDISTYFTQIVGLCSHIHPDAPLSRSIDPSSW
uniref:Uncharacterized protein n=1 Tax=Oryza brachyantha TaxID=4533 RepID=J3MM80_ORYBR